MNNYYKILQVDKDASPEIIKVAYKLLVKKYHPDLKEGKEKIEAEEKIKAINEAYDVLSDPSKKTKYDQTFTNESISQEQYNNILSENINLKKELDYFYNLYNKNNYYKKKNTNMYDNEYNSTKSPNSKINTNSKFSSFKKTYNGFNENIKTLIALSLTFLIIFIIIKLTFLRDFMFNIFGNGSLIIIIVVLVAYVYYFRNKK